MLDDNEVHPKKHPIGAYDTGILCSDCDRYIGEFDEYAINILRDREPEEIFDNSDFCKFKDTNNLLLTKFFLSVLWRASISKHCMFKGVCLGPYENRIKNIIFDVAASNTNDYPCILVKEKLTSVILDPISTRVCDLRFWYVNLGQYSVFIKVDKRQLTDNSLNKFVINNQDNCIYIISGDFGDRKAILSAMVTKYNAWLEAQKDDQ